MNYQEKAEKYVREQLPELSFTVVCRVSEKHPTGVRKTWRKPQLQHWLSVMMGMEILFIDQGTYFGAYDNKTDEELVKFNLTTGQPATEADYQAFCEIVVDN